METKTTRWKDTFGLGSDTSIWRYAGPKATSQVVVIPVLIFLSLNSIPAGFYLDPSQRIYRFRIIIAALLVAWIFFSVAGKIIDRYFPTLSARRVVLISVLFSLTETVRVWWFFNFDTSNAESLVSNEPAFYIAGAVAGGFTVLGLVSSAVNNSSAYKTSYGELFRQQVALQSKLVSVESSVEQTRTNLAQSTRDMLRKALASTLSEKAARTQSSKLIDELYWVSDELVRPLSHRLFDVPLEIDEEPDVNVPKVSFGSLVNAATTFSPFRPIEYTFILFLISAPVAILFPNWHIWVLWLSSLALIFLANYVGQRYCPPLLAASPLILRILFISLVFAVPVAIMAVSSINTSLLPPNQSGIGVIYGVLLSLLLGWALAVSFGLQDSRRDVLTELEKINTRLTWANTRLNSQLWLDQKKLALSLHNDVQSTLLAAAHKLSRSLEAGKKIPTQELKEVQSVISQSLELRTRGSSTGSIKDVVKSLNETWSSLIVMTCKSSREATQALKNDVLAREIVAEILSEFQINSLKHGKATHTEVSIATLPEQSLVLICTNNGQPLKQDFSSFGLGEKFLESVTLNFKYIALQTGTQLRCEIPIEKFVGVASKS